MTVEFDTTATTVDAVQRAAYRLSDRMSVDVRLRGDMVVCVVYPLPVESVELVIADFRNGVLDETLRARIRAETEDVRNAILSLAFSRTGLIPES